MSDNSMNHPLIGGVEDKTTEELIDIIAKLTKYLNYAGRSSNHAMANQLTMALSSYREELGKRERAQWDDQKDDDDDDLGLMISIQ